MLVIGAGSVLLLVIEDAVPYLRGVVVLVEDREMSYGENVSSCSLILRSWFPFRSISMQVP